MREDSHFVCSSLLERGFTPVAGEGLPAAGGPFLPFRYDVPSLDTITESDSVVATVERLMKWMVTRD